MLNDREKSALKKDEEEAWNDRMAHSARTDFRKFLIGTSHAVEVATATFLLRDHPEVNCLVVPVTVAINAWLMDRMDKLDDYYWQENWVRPYRTYSDNASKQIIDGETRDDPPRLGSGK